MLIKIAHATNLYGLENTRVPVWTKENSQQQQNKLGHQSPMHVVVDVVVVATPTHTQPIAPI